MSLGGERRTGLILAGGGARAAYQVGVLQVVADTLAVRSENPFPILVGSSAGALNAAVLGCGALDFGRAVDRLAAVWSSLETAMIYRSDWAGASRQAARFACRRCSAPGARNRWPCSTTRPCGRCSAASWISPGSPRPCASALCEPWRSRPSVMPRARR